MARSGYVAIPLTLSLFGCIETTIDPIEAPPLLVGNQPPLRETTRRDEIVQVLTPEVDILWTIDNSCSMADEQEKLAQSFPIFMDYFTGSGLDYHVGVTSTDIDQSEEGSKGRLVRVNGVYFIDDDTQSPVPLFTQMATLGTTGSGVEKGFGATYLALEDNRDTHNVGFYREDASIHTIVITDEPDSTPNSLITQREFEDWYDDLKQDKDDRTFNVIGDDRASTKYMNASEEIGGLQQDAATEDWSQILDRLGLQAAGFKREYFLSSLPVVDTVHVTVLDVNGALFDMFSPAVKDPETGSFLGDYTYDPTRNSITFLEYIPPELATVIIEYTLASAALDAP